LWRRGPGAVELWRHEESTNLAVREGAVVEARRPTAVGGAAASGGRCTFCRNLAVHGGHVVEARRQELVPACDKFGWRHGGLVVEARRPEGPCVCSGARVEARRPVKARRWRCGGPEVMLIR
jgi:hypothetical protein